MNQKKTKNHNIRFSEELEGWVEDLSEELDQSFSETVRDLCWTSRVILNKPIREIFKKDIKLQEIMRPTEQIIQEDIKRMKSVLGDKSE